MLKPNFETLSSDDDDDGEGEEPGLVLPCFGLVLSRRILVFALVFGVRIVEIERKRKTREINQRKIVSSEIVFLAVF
jgi:hypothetical protein